jgi:hypothetical protein
VLRGHRPDPRVARAELRRLATAGLTPGPRAGIDLDTARRRLVTALGADAAGSAAWQLAGGSEGATARGTALCYAGRRCPRSALGAGGVLRRDPGEAVVTPVHQLAGVLTGLDELFGARLSDRLAST